MNDVRRLKKRARRAKKLEEKRDGLPQGLKP